MEHIVEIKNLSKDYETGFWRKRKVRALHGLDLAVRPGQIFGFLGGNGAGKTTTIKILMSLLFPTEGSAKILGANITEVSIRSRIGYCPENPYFYDYLTPLELMDHIGEIFGISATHRKSKTEELLTLAGLAEKDWTKQLRKFSKGMQQRVGLAQSLINDPEIVFLDEPMSGLDPVGRREIREMISSLREKGTTVFMSTHILSDVEALCDEVAILRRGRLAASGNLQELLSSSGEHRSFEVMAAGVSADTLLRSTFAGELGKISAKPNGTAIEVHSEEEIEGVIKAVRESGGILISVLPITQSLEDLFVEPVSATQESD
ncbi:MAG TPA: ABC transporter ATP-binding protein [Pyrinomonadaceae bacterium]|nr:ABC transporter ATP-binding protein [Pyrinomonadaceae bacterium]HMP66822.1 ABC transporter ATP-binding protein [Pyrinomonadaceae bacterium]